MPFEEARAFVRQLNFKNGNDWVDYCESGDMPPDIPKTPQAVYKDEGWKDLGDWLGTGNINTRQREYLPFKEGREFARSLHLEKADDWRKYCKSGLKPDNIPSAPENYYKEQGWAGTSDWLGLDSVPKGSADYLPFEQARIIVHRQRIQSIKAWHEWCKSGNKPKDIPAYPDKTYKDKGWTGWRGWLGFHYVTNIEK